jgi:hypothetical protein
LLVPDSPFAIHLALIPIRLRREKPGRYPAAEELQWKLVANLKCRPFGNLVAGSAPSKVKALLCHPAVTLPPHLRPAVARPLWGEWPEAGAPNTLRLTHTNRGNWIAPPCEDGL